NALRTVFFPIIQPFFQRCVGNQTILVVVIVRGRLINDPGRCVDDNFSTCAAIGIAALATTGAQKAGGYQKSDDYTALGVACFCLCTHLSYDSLWLKNDATVGSSECVKN